MSDRLSDLVDQIARVTTVIADLESSSVDTKLGRGRLWMELADWNADAPAETADELGIGLSTMRQERWLAARFPDGSPAPWLNWSALRAIARFDDDTIAGMLAEAEAAGQATSEHVVRLAREKRAAERAGAEPDPSADPVTAASRAEYFRARAGEEFGVDFEPETCDRIAAWAERTAGEWENAAAATIEATFGPVPARAEVQS